MRTRVSQAQTACLHNYRYMDRAAIFELVVFTPPPSMAGLPLCLDESLIACAGTTFSARRLLWAA